ncbi:MAG: DUF1674 domain-containing protein [Alphaproteobacteria bacterium]|nr:DUF1674 domain-containing protein [Alphaproteobacteria bacterium]MCW5743338.1 DUF1674 domain-containing protein [Alphaproteobacteria bacterium]
MSSPDDAKPAATPFAEHRVETAKPKPAAAKPVAGAGDGAKVSSAATPPAVPEIGGPPGPEPTRYGDWQFNGKVTDF